MKFYVSTPGNANCRGTLVPIGEIGCDIPHYDSILPDAYRDTPVLKRASDRWGCEVRVLFGTPAGEAA